MTGADILDVGPHAFAWNLWKPSDGSSPQSFAVGSAVSVNLKSNKHHGRAVILSDPISHSIDDAEGDAGGGATPEIDAASIAKVDARDHRFVGRQKVLFHDGTTAHVRPQRMIAVLPSPGSAGSEVCRQERAGADATKNASGLPILALVGDTTSYRLLARSQVTYGDCVLEVGSSFGACTHVLASHVGQSGRVLGVDISQEAVTESRRRFPELRFECMDVLTGTPGAARAAAIAEGLLEESSPRQQGHLKVFLDIGGDRDALSVCRALAVLCQAFGEGHIAFLVCKSRNLLRLAAAVMAEFPHEADSCAFGCTRWRALCRSAMNGGETQ